MEQRQAYLMDKKKEGEMMQLKGKEFEEEMRRLKIDSENFKAYMKQNYDYLVSEKQNNKKLEVSFFLLNVFHNQKNSLKKN